MKITNKNNLPSALVNLAQDIRVPIPMQYSATTILKPDKMILLERRHFDDIEIDVSDMIWLIFGTAVHHILESHDKSGYAEIQMQQEIINKYLLTGKCDLYNVNDYTIEDYKTASVWKVIKQDFDDFKKQGLIYAWLMRKTGKHVARIKFHLMLKDWTARELRVAKLKGEFYPENAVYTWKHEININDVFEIERYIYERFNSLIANEQLSDDDIPHCSDEERWYSGDKFAIFKNGGKRALRVLDNLDDVKMYMENKGGDYYETRKGENRRCQDYCNVAQYCNFWKNNVQAVNEDEV